MVSGKAKVMCTGVYEQCIAQEQQIKSKFPWDDMTPLDTSQ